MNIKEYKIDIHLSIGFIWCITTYKLCLLRMMSIITNKPFPRMPEMAIHGIKFSEEDAPRETGSSVIALIHFLDFKKHSPK